MTISELEAALSGAREALYRAERIAAQLPDSKSMADALALMRKRLLRMQASLND